MYSTVHPVLSGYRNSIICFPLLHLKCNVEVLPIIVGGVVSVRRTVSTRMPKVTRVLDLEPSLTIKCAYSED